MRIEELGFLRQLINSLEQAEEKLEDAYDKEDAEELVKIKKFILKIQGKIMEVVK